MIPLDTLTAEQLRDHVRITAKLLAREHFRRHNPTTTEDEAAAFAERHWQQFKARAVDFLALADADRLAKAAAANN